MVFYVIFYYCLEFSKMVEVGYDVILDFIILIDYSNGFLRDVG